jgi:TetR/AcrR family transcriptional regulator, cholesterol catabolism regulator
MSEVSEVSDVTGATDVTAIAVGSLDVDGLTPEQLDRRRRIVDAAFELGAEKGYDAVQMRDVAAISNVSLATIYRYFSSKDHLLAAAMTEWVAKLQSRVVQSPPRGDDPVEQLVDVLRRACLAMERQPKLTRALVRALGASDAGVEESALRMRSQVADLAEGILVEIEPETRAAILSVLGHVWYSALVTWANGRRDFSSVLHDLDRATRVLVTPYIP